MKTGEEILKTFQLGHNKTVLTLSKWKFEELEFLKERYLVDYNENSSYYVRNRIDLINEAIEIKKGNEEQAWDYLT